MKKLQFNWTRVNNDINGNPRYVCHFLNLLTDQEKEVGILDGYRHAVKRANKLGGRKFHNKQYGGGIVFQSYNLHEIERHIFYSLNNS